MARYYRRRYTRVVKPKKKWASCIKTFSAEQLARPYVATLVQNSQQTANPTPVILKTGNFKVSLDMYMNLGSSVAGNVNIQAFILYVPEGWAVADIPGIVNSHPEWIMASKTVGADYISANSYHGFDTLNMSSRLKRNLNSGDGIVLLLVDNASSAQNPTLYLTGNVRYWICAN